MFPRNAAVRRRNHQRKGFVPLPADKIKSNKLIVLVRVGEDKTGISGLRIYGMVEFQLLDVLVDLLIGVV